MGLLELEHVFLGLVPLPTTLQGSSESSTCTKEAQGEGGCRAVSPDTHPLCLCSWTPPMGSSPWPPVTPRSPGAQQGVEEEDQDEDDEDQDGSSCGQEVSNSEGEWFLRSGLLCPLSLCAQSSSLGI